MKIAAQYISAADEIVLLGESGTINYQGDYSSFSGEVALLIQTKKPSNTLDSTSNEDAQIEHVEFDNQNIELGKSSPQVDPEVMAQKLDRQKGDWRVYKFYFQTFRPIHGVVFISLCVAYVALSSFDCMYTPHPTTSGDSRMLKMLAQIYG